MARNPNSRWAFLDALRSPATGKFLGVATAVFDVVSGTQALLDGDEAKAALSFTSAAGGLAFVLGTGPVAVVGAIAASDAGVRGADAIEFLLAVEREVGLTEAAQTVERVIQRPGSAVGAPSEPVEGDPRDRTWDVLRDTYPGLGEAVEPYL